ncbi:MAG: DUF1573 domain-containing protein [Verrucomicrobiia bacterium]
MIALGSVLMIAAMVAWADGVPTGRIAFDKPGVNFGVVDQQTVLAHVFTLLNTGSEKLQIIAIMTGCNCALVEMDSREIPPGGRARVRLDFNTGIFAGPIHKTITVRSSDPDTPLANFFYEADVQPVFMFSPPVLEFGAIAPGKCVEREVALYETRGRPFAIRRIACTEPGLKVETSPSGHAASKYHLKITLAPQQNSGPICARLMVETDQKKFSDPNLLLTGTVVGAVRVEPTMLFLGMVRQGEKFPAKQLWVRNAGSRPVEIRSVDPGHPALCATVTTNAPGRKFCIDLTTRHALPPGWMRHTLRIVTSESNMPLDVPVSGVVRTTGKTTPR